MTPGVQEEEWRNLWKYPCKPTTRRNRSHKNRALNRVPLNRLSGPERNGHSSIEAMQRPRCFHHATIWTDKVMRSVEPVLTIAFFFFFWIPDTLPPPVPPYHHSSGDTLTGHVWEGGKMDERARGQTPGLHISTVSKCLRRLCVSSSPDAAFPVNCTNLGPLPPFSRL